MRPIPPNLKDADNTKEACLTCKMYWHAKDGSGECWGYGNANVRENQVCDSWAASTKIHQIAKEKLRKWHTSDSKS